MTTVYPGALDALTNPTASDQTTSPSHAGQHANANDAIEAIQAELGTDPAGTHATVKARLDQANKIGAGCVVFRNSAQTLTTATYTPISWNAETSDALGFHDLVTNPTRLTVPSGYAGKYLIVAQIQMVQNSTSFRGALIALNGGTSAEKIWESWHPATPVGVAHTEQVSGVADLVVGDFIAILAFQNSGGNLDTVATQTKVSMTRIGD